MAITSGDEVTIEYTGRKADGQVFDTSDESVAEEAGLTGVGDDREFEPLQLEIGKDHVIDGVEEALVEMEEGEETTATIPPEKAYGERSEDLVREHPLDEFRENAGGQVPEEGAYIETQQGDLGRIDAVTDDLVRIDFNHELAGETLEFDIEVVDVE